MEEEKNLHEQNEERTETQDNSSRSERPQGRSQRPRIQRPANGIYGTRVNSFTKPQSSRPRNEERGFRPEGFGAGLQNDRPQRPYRPRYNDDEVRPRYNSNESRPRPEGYQRRENSYGQNRGYNTNREGGYSQNREGGYGQNRSSYGAPRQRYGTGYNPERSNYGNREGGYNQNREGGYNQNRGGYNQNRSNYGQSRGGYNQNRQQRQNRYNNNYDPNAKYSNKKRIEYKEEHFDPNEPIRLNKFLANAGVCSRREADDFIRAGVIMVNGVVVNEVGTKVLRTDEVIFHDTPVKLEKKVYVLLNKPKDYVTTTDDPQQRKTVLDLVKGACTERIYPVGRLDRNTTGVLLLTNDGELASKLTHPKFLKKKVYHVHLDKNLTAHDLAAIREGVTLEDGEIRVDAVDYADAEDKKQVGIEIHSGKNRIVRRIFESLGYHVTKLDRVLFAGLTKKNVRRGDWRYLTEEEVDKLRMGAYE